MHYYLGFDIGGTAIKYAIGSPGAEPIFSAAIATPLDNLQDFIAVFHRLIPALMQHYSHLPISGIGIATPGTIHRHTGLLKGVNPNLPWWVELSPLEVVPVEYRTMAVCDNDANLMTLAEAYTLPGIVLGITIGTGIGSGLVCDGRVYHGSQGFALELGHSCVVNAGRLCNCGLQGCLEAYSSVSAISKAAAELNPQYAGAELGDLILRASADSHLQALVHSGRDYLSMGLANACVLLDPDAIILGGGAMDAGLYDVAEISQALRDRTNSVYHHTRVVKALRGNQAGVMGAIMLAAGSR